MVEKLIEIVEDNHAQRPVFLLTSTFEQSMEWFDFFTVLDVVEVVLLTLRNVLLEAQEFGVKIFAIIHSYFFVSN
jgi:hypothetical protein